jgi:hypothetical protein
MTYYANAHQRSQLIAGLRAVAAYLESNPDVPAPQYTTVHVFPGRGTDKEQREAIDAIAACVNAEPQEIVSGHYGVSRYFGPVEYRAVAIDRSGEDKRDGE